MFLSNHAAGHPEIVSLGSEPLSRLDFQSRYPPPPPSREIFQHAFRRGGVDFFWNNPLKKGDLPFPRPS